MNMMFFIVNLVCLVLFVMIMPRLSHLLEIVNVKRKTIRINSDIPITIMNLWKYAKKFMLFFVFMIFPIIEINIPSSGSMTPTFRTWDLIFSSHIIYGLNPENIQIEFIRNVVKQYWQSPIFVFSEPQVGDNVVFRVSNTDIPYSKRIIAKEGDELWYRGNILTLNGEVCPIEYIKSEELTENSRKFKVNIYEITMPTFKHLMAVDEDIPLSAIFEHQYIKVPKGMYSCVGDYITNSADSRTLLGDVDKKLVFAKLQWIVVRNPNIRSLDMRNIEFGISKI